MRGHFTRISVPLGGIEYRHVEIIIIHSYFSVVCTSIYYMNIQCSFIHKFNPSENNMKIDVKNRTMYLK